MLFDQIENYITHIQLIKEEKVSIRENLMNIPTLLKIETSESL